MAVSPKFRLTVGELVSASLGIYLRNIIPFLFLGTLVMGPMVALMLWLADAELSRGARFGALIGTIVLANILTNMLTGAISYGVVMQLRGARSGLVDCIGKGFSSFARVFRTGIIVGLRIVAWAFTIFGLVREPIRMFVAVPAAVMEDKVGNDAARRSVELVRGSGGLVFSSMVLMGVVTLVAVKVVAFVIMAIDPGFDPNDPLLNVVIAVPVNTLQSTMMAVAYFLLRKGKENVDAKEIAKVFE